MEPSAASSHIKPQTLQFLFLPLCFALMSLSMKNMTGNCSQQVLACICNFRDLAPLSCRVSGGRTTGVPDSALSESGYSGVVMHPLTDTNSNSSGMQEIPQENFYTFRLSQCMSYYFAAES